MASITSWQILPKSSSSMSPSSHLFCEAMMDVRLWSLSYGRFVPVCVYSAAQTRTLVPLPVELYLRQFGVRFLAAMDRFAMGFCTKSRTSGVSNNGLEPEAVATGTPDGT